jgi:2-amino-4-hydroxy-6-hydroxymethyldihydropteridine diphosphokinase
MIILGIGSNLGDREENLRMALKLLVKEKKIQIQKVSSLYETAPVGYTEQNSFLNAVAIVTTDLTPDELMKYCLSVEAKMGRVRELRWGPRNIDIDVLCYNELVIHTELLTLPHPRLKERRFVLVPLLEAAGDIMLPDSFYAREALSVCPDKSAVIQFKPAGWEGKDLYAL